MKSKTKSGRPLAKAELSLQWTRDKQGTPKFVITGQPITEGKDFCTGVDSLIFAQNFALDNLVSRAEKEWLCAFFSNVKRYLDEEEKKKQLRTVHIYPNGMCGCFDAAGNQIPRLQGEWKELYNKVIFEDYDGTVKYFFGEFGGPKTEIRKEVARRIRFDN